MARHLRARSRDLGARRIARARSALLLAAAVAAVVAAAYQARQAYATQYVAYLAGPYVFAAIAFAVAMLLLRRTWRGALVAFAGEAVLAGFASTAEFGHFGPLRPTALAGLAACLACVMVLPRSTRIVSLVAGTAAGALLLTLANAPFALANGLLWIYAAVALAGPFLLFAALTMRAHPVIGAIAAVLAWLAAYALLLVTYGLPFAPT